MIQPTIQYKNDLYEIAKASMMGCNSSTMLTLDVYIQNSKVLELLTKHLPADKYPSTMVVDKTMRALGPDSDWDFFNITQVRYKDMFVTFQASKDPTIEDPEKNSYCTLIQINYDGGDQEIDKKVEELTVDIKAHMYVDEDTNHFYVITASENRLMLKREKIEQFDIDIELNYGKDFVKVYDNIMKSLTDKYSGLVMLYGGPGGGKTTLIRHIISQISLKKDIIYVPSYLMNEMANPDFISFIREQRESILVLEDAEEVLADRSGDGSNNQAVSNILNITNGLLNDAMKIQIIATFNMDKKMIDKALLRAGRLIEEWHLDAMKPEDANRLAAKLGHEKDYKKPIMLADVYDDCQNTTSEKKKKKQSKKITTKRVGFKDEDETQTV